MPSPCFRGSPTTFFGPGAQKRHFPASDKMGPPTESSPGITPPLEGRGQAFVGTLERPPAPSLLGFSWVLPGHVGTCPCSELATVS